MVMVEEVIEDEEQGRMFIWMAWRGKGSTRNEGAIEG